MTLARQHLKDSCKDFIKEFKVHLSVKGRKHKIELTFYITSIKLTTKVGYLLSNGLMDKNIQTIQYVAVMKDFMSSERWLKFGPMYIFSNGYGLGYHIHNPGTEPVEKAYVVILAKGRSLVSR